MTARYACAGRKADNKSQYLTNVAHCLQIVDNPSNSRAFFSLAKHPYWGNKSHQTIRTAEGPDGKATMSADIYQNRTHLAAMQGQPLLFVFHGTGGDENQFFDFGRQLLPDAGIISPRGNVSEHGALRFFRRR